MLGSGPGPQYWWGGHKLYFLTYRYEGSERIGVYCPQRQKILPLTAVSELDIPEGMLDFIRGFNSDAIGIINAYLTKGNPRINSCRYRRWSCALPSRDPCETLFVWD